MVLVKYSWSDCLSVPSPFVPFLNLTLFLYFSTSFTTIKHTNTKRTVLMNSLVFFSSIFFWLSSRTSSSLVRLATSFHLALYWIKVNISLVHAFTMALYSEPRGLSPKTVYDAPCVTVERWLSNGKSVFYRAAGWVKSRPPKEFLVGVWCVLLPPFFFPSFLLKRCETVQVRKGKGETRRNSLRALIPEVVMVVMWREVER